MPVVSFTIFPVSVLKTLQVIRCTWWGLAFPSTRGKQSKSVTSKKVLALRGFECVEFPSGFRRLLMVAAGRSLDVGGVNLCGDSVYLQCSRRRQEDSVRSLTAGFKGLGLMSPYQYRIYNLEGMRTGNRVVCTVCGRYGFPDFLLHQLQGFQMGL